MVAKKRAKKVDGNTQAEADSAGTRRPRRRREQKRAIETRQAILEAALVEFSEKGYEAASIREIGSRTGIQHPLITYHYQTKEILWEAVAEYAFAQILKLWDATDLELSSKDPMQRLRGEYAAFLRFTLQHPHFHHFMIRESHPGNPRLPWLVDTILAPALERLMPQIRSAQAEGSLPLVNPTLIHYMMIGIMSVLSSLGAEIEQVAGIRTSNSMIIEEYLKLIDELIFDRPQSER